MSIKTKKLVKKILFYVFICIFFFILVIFPFYWMLKTAFEARENLFRYPPTFFPQVLDLSGFIGVFTEKPIFLWLKNSLLVSVSVVLISMLFSTLSAYSLSRYKNRINSSVGFIVLITQMLPGTLFVLPIFISFSQYGLVNTFTGAIVAFTTFSLPICIWMLKGYFDSAPIEIEQAAFIDGCTKMGALFRVVIPLALPGYVSTAIFAFIVGWNEYMFAFVLLAPKSKWLLANGLASFIGEFTAPWNWVMAAAIIYTIPAVLLFVFLQRYLVQGLTAGAVKG